MRLALYISHIVMTTYWLANLRNSVRATNELPRTLQNLVIEYTAIIGEVLLYMPEVYPQYTTEWPYRAEGIWITVYDGDMCLCDNWKIFAINLYMHTDPLKHLDECISSDRKYTRIPRPCIKRAKAHFDVVMAACFRHLLA